uniref:Uncharacterized protein n=1 Tax=Kalanchoe fedtschenkoi TaxID=63787 RepID=A0A7N0TDY7_KALFE
MAKLILSAVAIFVSLASLLVGHTHATDALLVQGKVYCDTCRVGFETKLTQYLAGARVALECRTRETGELTFSEEGVTDATGTYKMEVSGDHEEDICLVTPTKSPRPDCAEVAAWEKARVLLTKNNGAITPLRYANSIGFTKKVAVDGCLDALRELGIVDLV